MSNITNSNSFQVDGKVCCSRHNFDHIAGVREFNNQLGFLSISKFGFLFKADNGNTYEIEFLPYTTLRIKIDLSDSSLMLSPNTPFWFYYSINENVTGMECIKRDSVTTIFLNNLKKDQIKQIETICEQINSQVEADYQRKLKVENKIISTLKNKFYKETISFIEQYTNDFFLSIKHYLIYCSFSLSNESFGRRHEDIKRVEYKLSENTEKTKKITDICFTHNYQYNFDSPQINQYDHNRVGNFVDNFNNLIDFYAPEIEQLEWEDPNINYIYITWQTLTDIVINYYHNFCITALGFKNISNILAMVGFMSANELTDSRSIMASVYYAIKEKFLNDSFSNVYEFIMDSLKELKQQDAFNSFADSLRNPVSNQKRTSIFDVDLMSGLEFEQFVAELFEKKGYKAEITKASGDQGIDVIAEKGGKRIGIQAKCYSGTVGNSAIQEAVAGKQFYNCDKVMVVTNNYFTSSAIELASANEVILWNRDTLNENIN